MAEYIEREAAIDEIEGITWYHISCQKNLVEGAACEAELNRRLDYDRH